MRYLHEEEEMAKWEEEIILGREATMSSPEELHALHGIFLEGPDRFNTLAYEPEDAEPEVEDESNLDADFELWLRDQPFRGSLRY